MKQTKGEKITLYNTYMHMSDVYNIVYDLYAVLCT